MKPNSFSKEDHAAQASATIHFGPTVAYLVDGAHLYVLSQGFVDEVGSDGAEKAVRSEHFECTGKHAGFVVEGVNAKITEIKP